MSELEKVKMCPYCEGSVSLHASSCKYCGSSFSKEESENSFYGTEKDSLASLYEPPYTHKKRAKQEPERDYYNGLLTGKGT